MKPLVVRVVKIFKDPSGKVVIWQSPNLPLIGWILCKIVAFVVDNARLESSLSLFGSALLLIWAYLEIRKGANGFRRILGAIVFGVVTLGYFM